MFLMCVYFTYDMYVIVTVYMYIYISRVFL